MSSPCKRLSFPLVCLLTKSVIQILLLQTLNTMNCANCQATTETSTTTAGLRHEQYPMNCSTTNTLYCNDVDMHHYIRPLNYNLTQVVQEITNGKGFFVLRRGFSKKDVGIARSIVDHLTKHNRIDTNTDTTQSAKHNSYGGKSGGIIWRLLGKGKIFDKIVQHPVTLEITRALLGPKSQISSYMSNTVKPGMDAQIPHMDYPYYDGFFPSGEQNIQRPLLSVGFMILLSKFTAKNGGTAFRPGSQKQPSYPHDVEDFYRNMVQLEGKSLQLFS